MPAPLSFTSACASIIRAMPSGASGRKMQAERAGSPNGPFLWFTSALATAEKSGSPPSGSA